VRILLDAAEGQGTYVPIDISREHLISSAEEIAAAYPHIRVVAVCADYTNPVPLDRLDSGAKRVIFFPGSTIGNFMPSEARSFLVNLGQLLSSGDRMIIGVDLQKDPRVLHAAYNDAAGVTARFNLNLLERMNRQLGAGFDVRRFEHIARYDPTEGRIEMHLRSRVPQQVRLAGETIKLAAREMIHTEYSYKYTRDSFRQLTASAGLRTVDCWTDDENFFSVWILEPDADGGSEPEISPR
jgi:L-histidine Nalpha-methyltransferase